MKRWHLIYTKSRQEELALANLKNQHYEAYLPLITKEKISRGKKILTKEPMFPSYLFVRLRNDGQQGWSPIRSTRGVSHLVSFGGSLAALDDEVIASLAKKLDKDPLVKAFTKGDTVQIVDGPFRGLEAIFSTFNGEERATLLLSFMAKQVDARFDLGQFKRVA
jgi:transcriptional antiterminator RfaH